MNFSPERKEHLDGDQDRDRHAHLDGYEKEKRAVEWTPEQFRASGSGPTGTY